MIFYGLLNLLVGTAIGLLTTPFGNGGMFEFRPWFTPPGYVFAIVWNYLYIGTAYVMYSSDRHPWDDKRAKFALVYFIHFLLQNAWPLIFFGLKLYALAEIVIVVLAIVVTIGCFFLPEEDRTAQFIWATYAAWLSFAFLLNMQASYNARHITNGSLIVPVGDICRGTPLGSLISTFYSHRQFGSFISMYCKS